jgi:hypothetical protein
LVSLIGDMINKEKKEGSNTPLFKKITRIGSIILAVSFVSGSIGLWVTYLDDQKALIEKNALIQKNHSDSIVAAKTLSNTDSALSSAKQLIGSQMQLLKLSNSTINILNEDLKKTIEISGNITSEKSYVSMELLFDADSKENMTMFAYQIGKYPVYDVGVSITDIWRRTKLSKIDWKLMLNDDKITISSFLGNFPVHSGRPVVMKYHLDRDQDEVFLLVTISTRNGFFNEYIKFKQIHSKAPMSAFKIMNGDGKIISQRISNNYPKDSLGKIDWEH